MPSSTRVLFVSVALALAVAAGLTGAAVAGRGETVIAQGATPAAQQAEGITVQGQGRVNGAPDVMRLDIGVEVRRSSVQEALDAANGAAGKVTAALRRNGVAAKDIQTTGLSISPEYRYANNTPPRIVGYNVSNRVRAKIRDLGKAGATIQAAATAGGNSVRIDGVSFDLEDNAALLNTAREAAFAEAKAKAEQYARLAGRRLGRTSSISETVSSTPPPVYYERDAAQYAGKAVPISPGEEQVSVLVTVVYDFA